MADEWTIGAAPVADSAGEWEIGEALSDPNSTYNAANALKLVHPKAEVTSQYRSPGDPLSVKNPNSRHIGSWDTIDVRPVPGMTYDQFLQGFRDRGYIIGDNRDEAAKPIKGLTTGPHWHVQILAGPEGLQGPTAGPEPAPAADSGGEWVVGESLETPVNTADPGRNRAPSVPLEPQMPTAPSPLESDGVTQKVLTRAVRDRPDINAAAVSLIKRGVPFGESFELLKKQFPEYPWSVSGTFTPGDWASAIESAKNNPKQAITATFQEPTGEVDPEKPEGLVDIAGNALKSSIYSMANSYRAVGALAAGAVGADETAKDLMDTYLEQEAANAFEHPQAYESLGDIEDLGDAGKFAVQGLATILPSLAGGVGSATITAGAARGIAGRAVKRAVEDRVSSGLTREAAEAAVSAEIQKKVTAWAAAGGVAFSAPQIYGQTGGDIYSRTGDVRPYTALAATVPAAALEVLTPLKTIKIFGGESRGLFTEVIRGALREGGTEAAQGFLQMLPADILTGESPFTWARLDQRALEFAIGALGGATTAAGASLLSGSSDGTLDTGPEIAEPSGRPEEGPLPGLPAAAEPLSIEQPVAETTQPGLLREDLLSSTTMRDVPTLAQQGTQPGPGQAEQRFVMGEEFVDPAAVGIEPGSAPQGPFSSAPATEVAPATGRPAEARITPGAYSRQEAQEGLEAITGNWRNKPAFEVVDSLEDVADQNIAQVYYDLDSPETPVYGFVGPDSKVRIIAGRIPDAKTLKAVAWHESLTHAGLDRKYGAEKNAIIADMLEGNENFRKAAEAYMAKWPDQNTDLTYNEQLLLAGEEVLAGASERGVLTATQWGKLKNVVKKYLRAAGLISQNISDKEIQRFLAVLHDFTVKGGEGVTPGAAGPSVIRPIRGWQGGAVEHDKYKNEFLGSGEGAHMWGYGHYFGELKDVGRSYRDSISRQHPERGETGAPRMKIGPITAPFEAALDERFPDLAPGARNEILRVAKSKDIYRAAYALMDRNPGDRQIREAARFLLNDSAPSTGFLYEVEIPDDTGTNYLDLDQKFADLPQETKDRVYAAFPLFPGPRYPDRPTSWLVKDDLKNSVIREGTDFGDAPRVVSERLREAGFVGSKYLDNGSRGKGGKRSRNRVVFSDEDIDIVNRFAGKEERLLPKVSPVLIRSAARPMRDQRIPGSKDYDPAKIEDAAALNAYTRALQDIAMDVDLGPALRNHWWAIRNRYTPASARTALLTEALEDRLPISSYKGVHPALRELQAVAILTRTGKATELQTLDDALLLMREEAEALDRDAWVPTARPMRGDFREVPKSATIQGSSRREGGFGRAQGKYWSNRPIEEVLNDFAPDHRPETWEAWWEAAQSLRKLNPKQLEKSLRDGQATPAAIIAARLAVVESGNRLSDWGRKHRGYGLTPEELTRARAEAVILASLQEALGGAVGNASRIVNSMRMLLGTTGRGRKTSFEDDLARAMRKSLSDEEFSTLLDMAATTNDAEAVNKIVRDAFDPKIADYATSLWYMSVLSGPQTLVNNFIGTFDAIVGDIAKDATQTVIGLGQRATGYAKADEVMTIKEFNARNYGRYEGAKIALSDGRILESIKRGSPASGRHTEGENLPWSGLADRKAADAGGAASRAIFKTLGAGARVMEFAPRVMAGMDEFFRSVAMTSEYYGLAAETVVKEGLSGSAARDRLRELASNPSPEFVRKARARADKATYRDEPSPFGKAVESLSGRKPTDNEYTRFGRAAFRIGAAPFVVTPDSIVRTALRHLPIAGPAKGDKGWTLAWMDRYNKADWASGKKGQARVLSRMLYGAAVLALFEELYREDKTHSSLSDDYRERNTIELGALPGAQDETSNDLMNLNNLGPTPRLATSYITLRDAYERGLLEEQEFLDVATGLSLLIGNELVAANWAEQPSNLLLAFDEAREGRSSTEANNAWAGIAASLTTPAIVRSYNQAFVDTTYRSSGGDTTSEAMRNRVASGWPGRSQELPPQVDLLGNELVRPGGFAQFILGNRILRRPDTPEDIAVQGLQKELGESPIGRARKQMTDPDTKEKFELDRHEQAQYAKTAGRYIRDDLGDLLASPEWVTMSAEERKEALREIAKGAREDARYDEFWNNPAWRGNVE